MSWEPRPLPRVTPETAPFWQAAAEERFLLSECADCGLVFYYPRAVCPDCFGEDVRNREAAGMGELYSYTVATQMNGWPDEVMPLVFAYVELDEGPRVISNVVECDVEALEIGQRLEIAFRQTEEDEIGIPVFRPADP